VYFWNAKKLALDLRDGTISEFVKMIYFVLFTIMHYYQFEVSVDKYFYIESAILIVIDVFGIYYCFRINRLNDNKNFMERIICLGIVLLIRIFVFLLPIYLIIGVIFGIFTHLDLSILDSPLFIISLGSIISIIFYFLLGQYIKMASKSQVD
jgi:hypothetical protein